VNRIHSFEFEFSRVSEWQRGTDHPTMMFFSADDPTSGLTFFASFHSIAWSRPTVFERIRLPRSFSSK
jgi:hypothetical protein